MPDEDKLGYYCVDRLKFYSKFDAAQMAEKIGRKMTWHFNDQVFGCQDWTASPDQSLSELYRQRAQQIRDSYDYVVLWYSGGADSDNILDTFVDNNIKLDEVAGQVNLEATKDTYGWLNAEIYHLTVPKIEKIKQTRQPWIRHTIVDICQLTLDYFNSQQNKFDWIYKANQYVNPNYFARAQIYKSQSHWMNMIAAGKRVAFVYGVDKPKLVTFHNKFYLVFKDVLDAAAVTHSQIDPVDGLFYEMFYWTPDLPALIVKQAHVVKNFIKSLPAHSQFLSKATLERMPSILIDGTRYWLTTAGMNTALYPNWHPVPYQVKPGSLIFSERDTWFFNLPDNDTAKQVWRQGLEYRWKQTPNWLKNDPEQIQHGFRTLTSRPYYIGT